MSITALMFRGSLGDELNVTPALRALVERQGRKVYVNSKYGAELFKNNPYVTDVEDYTSVALLKMPTRREHERHLIDHYAAQLGVHVRNRQLELCLDTDDAIPLPFDGLRQKVVTVDTRCGWPIREWPLRRFAEVCDALRAEGVYVVEVGKGVLNCLKQTLVNRLPRADASFLDMLSVRQTAYVISRSHAFLGCDSGLAHVASALGVSAVTLFGPVSPKIRAHRATVPVFSGCCAMHRVHHMECRNGNACMRSITSAEVLETVLKVLFCSTSPS